MNQPELMILETPMNKRPSDLSFSIFWQHYPRKVGKMPATKAWNRLTTKQKDTVLEVVPDWARAWRHTEKQYIPYPATWLNAHSFDDDLAEALPDQKPKIPTDDNKLEAFARQRGIEAKVGETMWDFRRRVETLLRSS